MEIGNSLPCEEDNFSCPRIGNLSIIPLQCYTQEELCNGVDLCEGGSDEGNNETIVSLECKKSLSLHRDITEALHLCLQAE